MTTIAACLSRKAPSQHEARNEKVRPCVVCFGNSEQSSEVRHSTKRALYVEEA
jgi:hypothetical protein